MIIWKGLGFVVVLIFFACMYCMDSLGWPKSIVLILGGGLVAALGLYLDKLPGREMIDKATGEEFVLKPSHSLFFIPVIYWAAVFAVFGIYYIFVK